MSEEHVRSNSASGPIVKSPKPIRVRRPSQIVRRSPVEAAGRARSRDLAMIGCFLLSISLPLSGLIFQFDAAFVLDEKRVLSSRPTLRPDYASLAAFPAGFEAFFNDHFGFRGRLIHWLNTVKVGCLRVSPTSQVILGRNGWLFFGDVELEYYRAARPFTAKQLAAWRRCLESRQRWLAARGIPYVVVVAPNKSTIYPEFMPRSFNKVHAESRLDQLMDYLTANSNLRIIDLGDVVRAAKHRGQVFYQTDSHWNNRGAYAGYARIMEAVSERFPQSKAIPRSEFHEVKISESERDLSTLLGMGPYYRENHVDLELILPKRAVRRQPSSAEVDAPGRLSTSGPDIVDEYPDPTLPAAVMFRDSFADSLEPFLSEHFRRIVFSWQYTFDRDLVEREKPDLVIQEMVERTLMMNSPPPP